MNLLYPNLEGKADHQVVSYIRYLVQVLDSLDARVPADAATLKDVHRAANPLVIRSELQAGGIAPLNITNLLGIPSQAAAATIVDTNANRSILYPPGSYPVGTFYWETDRTLLYAVKLVSGSNAWVYVAGTYQAVIASRPSGLGVNGAGVLFYATDQYTVYEWTGTAWVTVGGAIWQATINSATAFLLRNAAGANVLVLDTVNNRLGVNVTPTQELDVSGNARLRSLVNAVAACQFMESAGAVVLNVDTLNRRVGVNNSAPATDLDVSSVVNAATGYRVAGGAAAANVLRGNGTNFVSSVLAAADLSNGVTGTGAVVLAGSPTITTPTLSGGETVGAGGTLITQVTVYAPNLTPASVAPNTTAEQTFTVVGLAVSDKVIVNGPAPTAGTGIVNARASAVNTLALTFVNATAGALTPTAGVYSTVAVRS